MTAYQFGHLSWASRVQTKRRTSRRENGMTTRNLGWSAQDIASEAMRVEGHCEHVDSPQPPRILYGVDALKAAEQAAEWGDQATTLTSKGKKRALQRNAPVMACGVISWPGERLEEWPAYRDATVDALKDKYGDRLKSVVEHLDERHPHLHFYVVPRPGESFGDVHEGYAASREARKEPENKIRTAFREAMQGWQDWLHQAVGIRFGLERIGPARERREREEHMRLRAIEDAEKAAATAKAAAAQAEVMRDAAERDHQAVLAMKAEYEREMLLLEQQQEELAGELRDVRRERRALERQADELTAAQQQRAADLDAREAQLKADRAGLKRAFTEARTEGRKKGIEEAAAVSMGKKLGIALGVMREHIGETAKERELREKAEHEATEKTRLAREAAEAKKRAKDLEGSVGTLKGALDREREEKDALRREWGIESSDQARRIRELEQQVEAMQTSNGIENVATRRLR